MKVGAAIGLLASLIAVFCFFSGIPDFPSLLRRIPCFSAKNQAIGDPGLPLEPVKDKTEPLDLVGVPSQLLLGTGEVVFHKSTNIIDAKNGFSLAQGKPVATHSGDFSIRDASSVFAVDIVTEPRKSGVIDLGPVNFDSVREAPPMQRRFFISNYRHSLNLHAGHVYALALDGGRFYAKIHITDAQGSARDHSVTFRYALQRNGSRSFRE